MLPGNLEVEVTKALSQHHGKAVVLFAPSPVGGGSINEALRIRTSEGDYFLKWNDAGRYPGMFDKEAKGLGILESAGELHVPQIIAWGESLPFAWLLLEFIVPGPESAHFWEDFGQKLARLHTHTSTSFGLDHDNYIGSLQQSNHQHNNWVSFFIEERLQVQVKLARDEGYLEKGISLRFDKLYKHLDEIFPVELPSLLHGDLWNGNFMIGADGKVCLVDPAVYYGHREMDIAMSKLFGGFHFNFYAAYTKSFPLAAGWQSRVDICNLYPLLVHLNLFGSGYLRSIERVLRKF